MKRSTNRKQVAPGVQQMGPKLWRIIVRRVDTRSEGKILARERRFEGTLKEARACRAELVRELEEQTDQVESKPTLSAYSVSWLELRAKTISVHTLRHYSDVLTKTILPVLGAFYVDKLQRADIQGWVNGQVGKFSRETIRTRLRVLRSMWHDIADDHDLKDIVARIVLPTPAMKSETDTNSLSPQEMQRFLAAWSGKREEALVWLLFLSGARWAHVSGLGWDDFDASTGLLTFRRSHRLGRVSPINNIKRAPASLLLPTFMQEKLRQHREALMRRALTQQLPQLLAKGHMFPGITGDPRQPSAIRKEWAKALKQAGITKRFTPHGMRRSTVDAMNDAGVRPEDARTLTNQSAEMLAHYSSDSTAKRSVIMGKLLSLVGVAS